MPRQNQEGRGRTGDPDRPLSDQQKRFVAELLKLPNFNATKAALAAGYAERSARSTASSLLTRANIWKAIGKGIHARNKRLEIEQDEVLRKLLHIARAEVTQLVNWDDQLNLTVVPSDQLDETPRVALQELQVIDQGERGRRMVFKMHDKLRALDRLAQHLGLYMRDPDGLGDGGSALEPTAESIRNAIKQLPPAELAKLAPPEAETT